MIELDLIAKLMVYMYLVSGAIVAILYVIAYFMIGSDICD